MDQYLKGIKIKKKGRLSGPETAEGIWAATRLAAGEASEETVQNLD